MKETKLFEIISSMEKQEFLGFRDFITSPFFNKRKALIKFYDFLTAEYDEFIKGKISNADIYREIFQDESFDERKFWKLTSGLATMLDEYLIQAEFNKETYFRHNLLLESYRHRGIQKQSKILSRALIKLFDGEFNRGISYFQNQTHFYYQRVSNINYDNSVDFENDIKKLFENMKMQFITANLGSLNMILNIDEDFKGKYDIIAWHIKDILGYIEENKKSVKRGHKTVYLYYLALMVGIDDGNVKHFNELRRMVKEYRETLSLNILRQILLVMLNFSMAKLNQGDEKFLKEIYSINKILEERSLTFHGEYVDPNYYYSVVEYAVLCDEIEWAEKFSEKYHMYLSPEYRESARNLCLAMINFYKRDYNAALSYLLKVENLDTHYYLTHKSLLMQSHFELGNLEALDLIYDTVKKYIRRSKDAETYRENYPLFLKYLSKLISIKKGRAVATKKLLSEVDKMKYFLEKAWVLQKINELK